MPSLILGTAGHIDHGKTQLIKALTGVDTDRLAEEKKRGISIELGFANLKLPSGRSLGVVDVPGHERFVKNMVAGATGIDLVLLVVAADDGVMPQTREHLAIIDLLGIDRGVVAITKADLVEEDWLELVADEVGALVADSSLAGAPIVAVSSKTGEGLDELLPILDELAAEAAARPLEAPFRLPVDRVFTMAGAGTVITGTLWSGSVKLDDEIEVLPSGKKARARSIQVHGAQVEEAVAGQRVAINLAGLAKGDLARGDVLQTPGYVRTSSLIDAEVKLLPYWRKPLLNQTRLHLHHGTSEIVARAIVLGTDEIAPGGTGFVQLRLEEPLAAHYGDKFILRSYSPTETMGGGRVLDAVPVRHRRRDERALERLDALRRRDAEWLVTNSLGTAESPVSVEEIGAATQLDEVAVKKMLGALSGVRVFDVEGRPHYWLAASLDRAAKSFEDRLLRFHKENTAAIGIDKQVLKGLMMPRARPRVYDAVLAELVSRHTVVLEAALIRHPKASAGAMREQEELGQRLFEFIHSQGVAPQQPRELAEMVGKPPEQVRSLLGKLVGQGRLVKAGDFTFAPEVIEEVRAALVGYLKENERITASEFRTLIGASRKYAIPLLEYFDASGVTKRDGDYRVLRG
ncbi:MAG: selenocysteine-specific translation elongation factor [Actinobacteria bacterium]|nr:MAG: selenocysteine-specific translation elongation factor [Actinomycetota bacterium]